MLTTNSFKVVLMAMIVGVYAAPLALAQDTTYPVPETQHEVLPPLSAEDSSPGIILPSKSRMMPTKLRAVLITANGCGKCKILRRKLEYIPSIAGVDIVELEFMKKNETMFYGRAYSLGVEEAIKSKFNERIEPGSLYLINLNSKRVISEIKHNESTEKITQQLRRVAASF